ncbi:DUF1622 domain-containing protein [Spirosoma rhododendri]|uniref:DUF1622 domain-containing protein n=1 Tax=Spirosoma rhododendri TaxID=2728024 RepID=A0A7L5E073_9BACT|nr:DUF1622 domain-containing protein [Spirosoma rhododendri]QJD81607.1 DUF1622 domain-containing protein [Spirosoma rhododendri]
MQLDVLHLPIVASLVDLMGTLLIEVGSLRGLVHYVRANDKPLRINAIQQALAADLVMALSFKSGAGIIRTLTVVDWPHFLLVIAVIGLRFFLSKSVGWIFPLKH